MFTGLSREWQSMDDLSPKPPCQQCGNPVPELLRKLIVDGPGFGGQIALRTIYVFQCDCGWAFTHTVLGTAGKPPSPVLLIPSVRLPEPGQPLAWP